MRHSEGSRDELPEAPPGPRGTDLLSRGRPAGAWKLSDRGPLGQTGRLGLARPGSAAEGRGDGRLRARFLRAWSGPQAVSSVRRARGRRGPHKRRATIANRSVRSQELRDGGTDTDGSPREAPLSDTDPPVCLPGTVRTVLIHSGWEKLDKPSGGFFKGGKEEKARELPGLEKDRRLESFRSSGDRFFGRGSPADRATLSGLVPPSAPRRDGSNETSADPLRRS